MELLVLKVAEIGSKVPEWIQVVPLGDLKDGKGFPFRVTAGDVSRIIERFKGRVNDMVVDYEHQTLGRGEAPAAGWIVELANRGEDGLWARVNWTDRGKTYIEGREYRYLSPVLLVRKGADGVGVPHELHSAALTNDPAIDGMVPLVNKNEPKESEMDLLKKLIEALGLDANTDETKMVEHVAAMKKQVDEKPEPKTEVVQTLPDTLACALDLKSGATIQEAEATVHAIKQKLNSGADDRVQKLQEEVAAMKAEKAVDEALEEGKITSAQKDWANDYATRDPKGFALFVSKATPVVPTDRLPKGDETTRKDGAPDETTLAIAKQFGNSEDDLVKFGGLKEV